MPRVRPKVRIDPDKVYACWNSFGGASLPGTIRYGTRLRGSADAVRLHPENWVDADLPESEWPNIFADLPAPAQDERPRSRAAQEIPDGEAVVPLETFMA